MKYAFIFLSLLLSRTFGKCVMTQDCAIDPSHPECMPRARTGANTNSDSFIPAPYTGPAMFNVCPQYDNVCCSNVQMQTLFVSFLGIAAAFGSPSNNGCPACLANVILFWCKYTCDPEQGLFLTVGNTSQRVDPVSQKTLTVLNTAITIDNTTACATFESCKGTGKVKEFPPMQTCEGFFTYQGQTESIQDGRTFIDINYTNVNDNHTLGFPLSSCCNYNPNYCPTTIPFKKGCTNALGTSSSINASCPCTSCTGMCTGGKCAGAGSSDYPNLGAVSDDPLIGFDILTVVGFYVALLLFTIFVQFLRAYLDSKDTNKKLDDARGSGKSKTGKEERFLCGEGDVDSLQGNLQQQQSSPQANYSNFRAN